MANNTLAIVSTDLVKGTNNIAGFIGEIATTGKKLDRMIQIGLCSVVAHAHAHGDYTQVNNIIESLPAGVRTNAARSFVESFAPVRWNKKTKKFVFEGSKRDENFEGSAKFNTMMSTDWLSFKADKNGADDFKQFDTVNAVESMIKRVKKAMEDERNNISAEEIAIMENAMAAIAELRRTRTEEALLEAATAPDA
ncbi:MAG: hypothetical protein ACRDCE_19925 [Cetobacterium sp.]|uniref:hypothetical protein n=1 Tax=Cetobacterium sp. TaxID=2071632 RepID=UPI003EE81F6A